MLLDLLEKISIVHILHDDVESVVCDECLLVLDNVRRFHRG